MRSLVLHNLKLNPSGSVNWSSLISLSIMHLKNLTEGVMEKVLSGCPNSECLEMDSVWGIRQSNWRLEISSVKLKKLILKDDNIQDLDLWFEILAPYVQNLQILRFCGEICMQQRNVHSLVTVVLCLNFYSKDGERNLDKEGSYMKELLHSVAHVENLELSLWCIECMSRPALEGWQSPPSSWKFLKLNTKLEQLDFPRIYSFLQRSSYLETLLIDWNNYKPIYLLSWYYKNKVEKSRRFETHKFSCPLLHLKTIKFVNLVRPLNESKFVLPLVKYLLENAIMLEKFDIAAKCKGSEMSRDYVKIEQELLSFPRSSEHASLVFSYQ